MTPSVIALPGGVKPAVLRYEPLLSALGSEVDFHLKDLEVYAGDEPPADYSIQAEVEAVERFANSMGWIDFTCSATRRAALCHWPSPAPTQSGY